VVSSGVSCRRMGPLPLFRTILLAVCVCGGGTGKWLYVVYLLGGWVVECGCEGLVGGW